MRSAERAPTGRRRARLKPATAEEKEEDAVVETIDGPWTPLQEEIVRSGHQAGHYEEDEDAREEKGEEEADERPAGEPVSGGAAQFMFGSHNYRMDGIMREVERGEKGRIGRGKLAAILYLKRKLALTPALSPRRGGRLLPRRELLSGIVGAFQHR